MSRMLTIARVVWLEMLRRKDIYVLIILCGALLAGMGSINIFGLGGAVSHVKDTGLFMAWVFGWLLAVNAAARELPQEEARGTVFPLLAKPVTRADVVLGKWLGAWSIVTVAVLIFYGLTLGMVMARGGRMNLPAMAQGLILHAVVLAVLTAIAMACSTRMNHDAAASLSFVMTAASFWVVPRIAEFVAKETGWRATLLMILYNVLPHFEVLDLRPMMVREHGVLSAVPFFLAAGYGVLLTAFFLLLAWMGYRHKRFSRDTLAE